MKPPTGHIIAKELSQRRQTCTVYGHVKDKNYYNFVTRKMESHVGVEVCGWCKKRFYAWGKEPAYLLCAFQVLKFKLYLIKCKILS